MRMHTHTQGLAVDVLRSLLRSRELFVRVADGAPADTIGDGNGDAVSANVACALMFTVQGTLITCVQQSGDLLLKALRTVCSSI